MTEEEWRSLVRIVNEDIVAMTRARAVRDQVRSAIEYRKRHRMEEQFIDADAFGSSQPVTYDIHSRRVVVEKIHRAGMSCTDIKGADLFYEIPDVKFALIQYKSPNSQGRVGLDKQQVQTLRGACPCDCPPSSRFRCGSWFAVRSTTHNSYYPACEAQAVFAPYQSRQLSAFINGLAMETFHEDFRACRVGARTAPVAVDDYRRFSIAENRVFIHARRLG